MAELTTTNVGNTFNSGAQFHLTKAAKTFNAGASDAVHIITEGGVAPAAASNFGVGSTGITTTVVSLFNNLNQG